MIDNKRCVLIVDDEVKMVRAIKDFLRANNFYILEAYNGEQALDIYFKHQTDIDLILLDVMMPETDGFEVLSTLRESGSLVPIVMLTARGEEYDQLKGFDGGADDYIVKPFSPSLLIARVESVLRRVGKGVQDNILKGGIQLNATGHTVSVDGGQLDLTKREFDLLYFFLSNHAITFTRDQILNNVWGYDYEGDIRTVDTHIKQIRLKLGDKGSYIKTVHRVGYKFEANKIS